MSLRRFSVGLVLLAAITSLGVEARAQRGTSFPSGQRGIPAQGQRGGRGGQRGNISSQCNLTGRIEKRTYLFKEAKKKLEYDVLISSKVQPHQKSPLVIALHGLRASPTGLLACLSDDAQEGGYIVAAPKGYDDRGYYGAGQQLPQDNPPNRAALSEKDVMNVLELVRAEFTIDDQRIYILGQSMGGAGALYLGIKHPEIWAAIGASAPAITLAHDPSELERAADMPIIVLHGADDQLVGLRKILAWVDEMKALNTPYEFHEIPNTGHPDTIQRGAGYIFAFFNRHIKQPHP